MPRIDFNYSTGKKDPRKYYFLYLESANYYLDSSIIIDFFKTLAAL